MTATRAAIYARYSSDSQREESIEIQIEQCADWCAAKGWDVCETYCDFAMSGTNADRPAFQRLLADAESGAFDAVVVLKTDRFARNVEVSRAAKRRLGAAGVRFASVREGESTGTAEGFLNEAMGEVIAEYYSRNLSKLIRDGVRKNAERYLASGRRVYGYDVDERDRFVVNEAEAANVRDMFEWYVGGLSTGAIAERLNDRKSRTRMGNPWTVASVNKVLMNPAYKGVYRYGGVVAEGQMPVIVEPWLWEDADAERKSRKGRRKRARSAVYPLSGVLRCAECGAPMCGSSGTSKSKDKYRYYICNGKGSCGGMRLPADRVEGAVLSEIREILEDPGAVDAMVEEVLAYAASIPSRKDELEAEREELKRANESLTAALSYNQGVATISAKIDENERRILHLGMELAREEYDRRKLLDEEDVRDYIARMADAAECDDKQCKILVETFIDKIYIDRENIHIVYAIGDDDEVFGWEELVSLKKNEHPLNASSEGVRTINRWWR
ncbi:recombinase family protein [Adlercreutzia sp. R25]|uniref:recombinase family protein n=1 Tax=Adlercreutzia shanghongiae TaxID=3111773 RepID=UPI002DB6A34E|nr:recombinase family protein [Adlercreutzia sp. R25]MEC4272917.1 recombinase family protein [Adlercreutzia sp. R25]